MVDGGWEGERCNDGNCDDGGWDDGGRSVHGVGWMMQVGGRRRGGTGIAVWNRESRAEERSSSWSAEESGVGRRRRGTRMKRVGRRPGYDQLVSVRSGKVKLGDGEGS